MDKTVDTLVPGESLLVAVKAVKGGKYQIELAEVISNPYASSSDPLTALFNAGDPRFSTKARRAWRSGEKSAMENLLGIKFDGMAEGDVKELNILNPKAGGKTLKVRVMETTTPDADRPNSTYQKDNIETTAKRAGADGDYIFHNGEHIFSNTKIVATNGEDADHIFLAPDSSEYQSEPVSSSSEELAA